MFIKDLKNCNKIIAGDNSILRELLHPNKDKADLKIGYSIAQNFYVSSIRLGDMYHRFGLASGR